MNLVILDGYTVIGTDLTWQLLRELPGFDITAYDRTRAEEVVNRCREADAVLTNKVAITEDVLRQLPRLRYIGVLATGYNVVDIPAARRRNITVTNIPAYSTASVAQSVFAHLLNVTNSVAHYAEENRRGRWTESPDFMWADTHLFELAGKTMVIRGMGNIGTQVAHIALAFGMRVVAVSHRPADELPPGVRKVDWEEALSQADVLSLHCPLTDETREIINHGTLAGMKPTAIIINTGRGPLIHEGDVAQTLRENRIAAYCADVLTTEPARPDNPLLTAPRCYLTPHIAWATHEARQRLIRTATENLRAYLNGQPVNVVS